MHLPLFFFITLFSTWTFASPVTLDDLDSRSENSVLAKQPCPEGAQIIGISGHGSPPHGYGLLNSAIQALAEAVPNSHNYSLAYPKETTNFTLAAMVGVNHLTNAIEGFAKRCPDTGIVLIGYSEGAIVLMNTLCGRSHIGSPYSEPLNSSYAYNIIASVVYGDDTRVPYQPYDLGTCTKGQGVNPRGNPQGCKAFAPNMASYCDRPDPVCCGGNKQVVHYQYGGKYNPVMSQFVADQYAALRGK